ncbi:MAG: dihydroneopterin aldolase, partial [Coprococcus sp.]
MDKICIRRLEVYAHHGVYEEEKRLGQKFYITVEMELDTRAAGISDDLQASVNY